MYLSLGIPEREAVLKKRNNEQIWASGKPRKKLSSNLIVDERKSTIDSQFTRTHVYACLLAIYYKFILHLYFWKLIFLPDIISKNLIQDVRLILKCVSVSILYLYLLYLAIVSLLLS